MPAGEVVHDAEEAAERRGVFKHADLYKMHTYRDAIASARSIPLSPGEAGEVLERILERMVHRRP